MIRRPPRSTRTDTLFPYTTLFRSSRRRPLRSFQLAARMRTQQYQQFIDVGRRFGNDADALAADRMRDFKLARMQRLPWKRLQRLAQHDGQAGAAHRPAVDEVANDRLAAMRHVHADLRSEERRVGKECVSKSR